MLAADPRLADPTFLRLMALRRKKRMAAQAISAQAAIPQTDDELWDYVVKTWGVRIPRTAVCPGHVAPFTAFADAYFGRHSMIVIEASRGFGGKSLLLATLGATMSVNLGASVSILGGSGEQSRRVHKYLVNLWDYPQAPRHLLATDPMKMETHLTNGSHIIALLASSTSVRGGHPEKLLLDEADEMDLSIFDAAMGQTLSRGTIPAGTVISSTHNYAHGTYTEILKRAGERGWPLYRWCWRDVQQPHGWLDPVDVERKKQEVTTAMWANEYDLQEPNPGSRAIDPAAVALMFRRDLGEYVGENGEYLELEPPIEGATYAHGADWAKSQDWTIVCTIRTDVLPMRVVAFERMGRLAWPYMVGRYNARILRYGRTQSRSAHDATGLGAVVDGYLEVEAEGVILVGRARTDLLSNYINAVEKGVLESPYIAWMAQEHQYASVNDLYGSGHLPDTICSMALAYKASGFTLPADVGEEQMQAIWQQADAAARQTAAGHEQHGTWEDLERA